jgi:hypothetical protein
LSINGDDLKSAPQLERKRRLRAVMPRIESRLKYVDYVKGRGLDLFWQVCRRDLEGIVAKYAVRRDSTDGVQTSWIKIKNRHTHKAWGGTSCLSRARCEQGVAAQPSCDPRWHSIEGVCHPPPQGAITKKGTELDCRYPRYPSDHPTTSPLTTDSVAVLGVAISPAGMTAVSWVSLT